MAGFGVYIHWPYCARICPYCDFNVYRDRGGEKGALVDAIAADIAETARRIPRRPAESIFFGGGTPSLLSAAEVSRLIAAVDNAFGVAADCEITLEANPEDHARFGDLVSAGVNRLSLGVQALRDADLKGLGRTHSADGARAAIEVAAHNAARVSVDFIYARSLQSVAEWRVELAEALLLPVEHLSLYQLTIEAGTAFERAVKRGRVVVPAQELAADFYEATQEICEAAGFSAYEVSNHARGAGQSRHNLIYWRGGDWVGAGPGAHGRIALAGTRTATFAHRRPEDYIRAVSATGVGWAEETLLTNEETREERILMGVRIAEGLPIEIAKTGALAALSAQGLIRLEDQYFTLTPAGRLVADAIAAALI